MQYELYIDVFFLVNFLMDYLVLLIIRRALSCSATHGNVALGALTGAVCTCAVIMIPMPSFIKIICLHTLINTLMVIIGLKAIKNRIFWKSMILLYLTSFLLGGAMNWIAQYTGGYFRIGCLFFGVLIGCWFLVTGGLRFLESLWKLKEFQCEATLYIGEHSLRLKAVIDSGNGLYDTLTGKPVNIIDKKAMEKLTETEKIQKVRYIPFRTVEKGEGVLPVITIDRMCIHGKKEKEVISPLIGISGQHGFLDGTYELILHPHNY